MLPEHFSSRFDNILVAHRPLLPQLCLPAAVVDHGTAAEVAQLMLHPQIIFAYVAHHFVKQCSLLIRVVTLFEVTGLVDDPLAGNLFTCGELVQIFVELILIVQRLAEAGLLADLAAGHERVRNCPRHLLTVLEHRKVKDGDSVLVAQTDGIDVDHRRPILSALHVREMLLDVTEIFACVLA